MTTTKVPAREVADLLRDLRRMVDLPADDPQRQAWLERKRDVLERIGRYLTAAIDCSPTGGKRQSLTGVNASP